MGAPETEPNWDEVEDLAFQVMELRESGPDGVRAAERLLAARPELASGVALILSEVEDDESLTMAGERVGRSLWGRTVPSRLGPYVLGDPIGRGGMGAVYRARDGAKGVDVALKIVRPELLDLGQSAARFEREVAITRRLDHPGIVPVLDAGETDGMPWLAMELVPGRSVGEVLHEVRRARQGVPTTGSALVPGRSWAAACGGIAEQVAEAMAYAHEQGVLHRDLKPTNLMLDGGGRARLLDFGLARDGVSSVLTQTGMQIGSLRYMAPEQYEGHNRDVDERTDVFALGRTLVEMLTLEPPRPANFSDPTAVIEAVSSEPTNAQLAVVCAKATREAPMDRYQTMREMADALGACECGL